VFLNRSKSGLSPETCLPWETLPGANAPDNIAPGITEPLKLLHHGKVAIRGEIKGYMGKMKKKERTKHKT